MIWTKPRKKKGQPSKKKIGGDEPRQQYAALPWRVADQLEIMLLSSRETRRWVIPKGWPMAGRKPPVVAAVEAMEEAGLVGEIETEACGHFHYNKIMPNGAAILCRVEVFPLKVLRQRANWPEREFRTTQWFSAEDATHFVREPELQELIRNFSLHKAL